MAKKIPKYKMSKSYKEEVGFPLWIKILASALFILAFCFVMFKVVPDLSKGAELKWQKCNEEAWEICAVSEKADFYEYLLNYTDYYNENVEVIIKFEEFQEALQKCYVTVAEMCDKG